MKAVALILSLLFTHTAWAAGNTYQGSSSDAQYEITYSVSSKMGRPQMQVLVFGDHVNVPGETKTWLSHEKTMLGKLVSLSVANRDIADAPTIVYSIFIPRIEKLRVDQDTTFSTQLLISSIGGRHAPWVPTSRVQEAATLNCVAQSVWF